MRPRRWRSLRNCSHWAALSPVARRQSTTSFLPVGPQAEGDQHRAAQGAGPGLAGQHHPVEHEHRVLVRQRAAVEGGDRRIEGLGDLADRSGADPPAQHRQQGAGHLAGRQPEDEAGQDHAVDVAGPAGIGAQHGERAVAPGARHMELDVAQLGQQVTGIRTIAPVRLSARGHLIQVAVDRRRHAPGQDALQGLAGRPAVVLAPFDPLRLHGLHHPERTR